MSSEVPIPEAAVEAYLKAEEQAHRDGHSGTAYAFGLRAAAPLIVAASAVRLPVQLGGASDDAGVRAGHDGDQPVARVSGFCVTWGGTDPMSDFYGSWHANVRTARTEGMSDPVRCNRCHTGVYDLGTVEVTARYVDCSMWKAPCCQALVDDRGDTGWKSFSDYTRLGGEAQTDG